MNINPYIFRGYDLRGLVDKDLNPEIAEHLGRAYGTFLAKRGIRKTVIGRDCRLTSKSYGDSMIRGLLSTGIDVIDIGLALAGNLYWAQYYFESPGCVLVSASHNPAEYNGFKFGTGFSTTMVGDEIQELRQIAEKGEFAQGDGSKKEQDVKNLYIDSLVKRFTTPFKFKVVVDPGHSTPGIFAPDILRRAGCEVVCSHCELDGTFPIGTPDPTAKEMAERLSEKVVSEASDLGFSYDSDGDRIGVVDERGGVLWNDVLIALFVLDVLERNPGAKIVFNALCSKVVEDVIKANKGVAIMWRTGHSFIKAKAQQEKALFAGELSGHFYFLDEFYPHDDACYSSLRLLNYLALARQTLSEALAVLPKYISSPEIKVFCADEKKVELIEIMKPIIRKDFPEAEIIDDERVGDGIRINLPEGMFIIRYSQNGPYLTVKFEGKNEQLYNKLREYIKTLLLSYEEINWNSKINVNIEAL